MIDFNFILIKKKKKRQSIHTIYKMSKVLNLENFNMQFLTYLRLY